MKKVMMAAMAIVAGSLTPAPAMAADLKIGIVDLNVAVQNTSKYQAGMKRLQSLKNRKEGELQSLRQRIEETEKGLLSQSMAMSPDRVSEKQVELKNLRKKFSRKQQDAREELEQERNRLQQSIFSDAIKKVEAFGARNNYDFILAKPAVLYHGETHDITGEITRELDAK